MIRVGDKFKLMPTFQGSEWRDQKSMVGTVVAISRKGWALLDFGFFRECFPFFGPDGLATAARAKR